jgi:hypothetical protein
MASGASHTALLVAIAILLAIAIAALALIARPAAVDERCRFRLFRLGGAVNAWIDDHGHRSFPSIVNPASDEPWLPGRTGSAGLVLWNYLGGDIPSKPRANETPEAWAERLRGSELSVCPASGLEYWYEDQALGSTTPAELVAHAPPEIRYFRCQLHHGLPPHHYQGADGAFAAFGMVSAGGIQQVSRADLQKMRSDLAALEADTSSLGIKDRQERIGQLRERIESLEQAMGTADQVEMKRLSVEVRFLPQGR